MATLDNVSILDGGISSGTWDAQTRTMGNTSSTVHVSRPRFEFGFAVSVDAFYEVRIKFTGDLSVLKSISGLLVQPDGSAYAIIKPTSSTLGITVITALTPTTSLSIAEFSVRQILGNHAYQTVSASRPILTNRVNLFNNSENFSTWLRNDGVALATPNPKYPNAVKLSREASAVFMHHGAVPVAGTYTLTGLFKNVVGDVSAVIGNNGRVVMSKVGTTSEGFDIYQATQTISSILNISVTGIVLDNNNSSVEVYGLDIRQTQQSTSLPPYQKVVAGKPSNSIGFPNYLLFDGVDDFLQTANIDFSGTDKMSLFAGLNQTGIATVGTVLETGSNYTKPTGGFGIQCPAQAGRGSVATMASAGGSGAYTGQFNTPDMLVYSDFIDLSKTTARGQVNFKVNGVLANPIVNGLAGNANFANVPVYIGRLGGISSPFNGHIYGLIGIGKLTTDTEITAIEKELAKRTGVTLNV